MSSNRVWLTLSRGISPELSEPIFERDVDADLADAEPLLIVGLRKAVRNHLALHGIIPVDDHEA